MENIIQRVAKIKFILTDVDGVLTDGRLHFFPDAKGKIEEFKSFSAVDGLGVLIALKCGLNIGIITGRAHDTTVHRAKSLGMKYIYQGFLNKIPALEDIMQKENLAPEQIAYIGDDIIDLAVMKRVGVTFAPQDARLDVREKADYTTKARGGKGVLREAIEAVLKAQEKWDTMIAGAQTHGFQKPKLPRTQIITADEKPR